MLISIVPAPFFAPPIFATTYLLSKWKGPVPDIFVHRGISSIINVFEDKERNCLGDNTLPFQSSYTRSPKVNHNANIKSYKHSSQ